MKRLKALIWIILGLLVFYFVAFGGREYRTEQLEWPAYKAEVLASNISWATGMTDEYQLAIKLKIYSENNKYYTATIVQSGPKGALEKRVNNQFATGKTVKVRVNPNKSRQVILDTEQTWAVYIVAVVFSLLFIANGLTVLFKSH